MKRIFSLLTLVFFIQNLFAQQAKGIARPKLVVGIVIDQMRWDYLYRYYDRYTANGFKRLMNGGYNCENTMINYLPSYTAPGHTCIYTGSVPAIHGIAGNDWVDKQMGKNVYCADDGSVRLLDKPDQVSMSPRNLFVTTVTDELRLATNFKSRVYGIAIKDRSSIFPAGHIANGAYWYNDNNGRFTSSTYYGKTLPEWLQQFNARQVADSLTKENWNLLYAANSYTQSTADNNEYEINYRNEKTPQFPHVINTLPLQERQKIIKGLPAGNTLTFEMAKACISGEQLGNKGSTDFLCLSFSSTDYVGHQFGPNSVEAEDMYLRFDKELAQFLSYLDSKVGQGNYLLFLSADHGAAHNAGFMKDNNVPAGGVSFTIPQQLNAHLKKIFERDSLVLTFNNYQVYLNEKLLQSTNIKREKVKAAICEWFNNDATVAYAIDMENMDKTPVPEPIRTMAINGYNSLRSGCIQVIFNAAWYETGMKGTTHGSWNPYDTHIPLLWYGWHVPKGVTTKHVDMTDIAPTIAALLHIQIPNGCVGKVIPFDGKD